MPDFNEITDNVWGKMLSSEQQCNVQGTIIGLFLPSLERKVYHSNGIGASGNHSNMTMMQGNSSSNVTEYREYVFTPLASDVKIILTGVMYLIGATAVAGNTLVLFLKRKENRQVQAFSRSVMSFFVKSLAWSDLSASVISIPLINLEILVDIFPDNLRCKVLRYVCLMFPVITINNLIVIGVERYLAVFHPYNVPTKALTRRMVLGAWILGALITLIPALTYSKIPFNIGPDRYTLVCRYDNSVPAFRVMFVGFTFLVYFLPCVVLSVLSARILKYMNRCRISQTPPTTVAAQKWRFKGSHMAASLILTFVLPYMLWMFFSAYFMIFRPSFSFETDLFIRLTFGFVCFANGIINPIIYFYYSREMRKMLKDLITSIFPS